jgi:AraC-like DNA-binding protein
MVASLRHSIAEQGTTVTDWIRERRLAGCRRDLADPTLRDVPIGDVAVRWGYRDQAYFSRLFRRAFGETPREWRARAAELQPIG